MAFKSEKSITSYMDKCLRRWKLTEFEGEDILPEYFGLNFSDLIQEILEKKQVVSKANLVNMIWLHIKKEKWSNTDILHAAFSLELDFIIKYHSRFEWKTNKFQGISSKKEIGHLGLELRRGIRSQGGDALVTVVESNGFFWISVVTKDLKVTGLYSNPFYIVLSDNGKYFFIKRDPTNDLLMTFCKVLGYEKFKKIKLSGRDLKSLVKLLIRRERVDINARPIYQGGEAVENEYGMDMTQKKNYENFYNQCVDGEDIYIEEYKITASKCSWLGNDLPILKDLQFDSAIKLSGDVARIIKQLPIASIIRPPFPDFFVNFSVSGKNRVIHRQTSLIHPSNHSQDNAD